MLSKDLSRLIQQEEGNSKQEEQPQMKILKTKLADKPFWTFSSEKHKEQSRTNNPNTHGQCCFNHIIGLPAKDGKQKPMFDYEKLLYRALMENSYLNSDISQLPRPDSIVEREKRRRQAAEATYADFKNKHVWVKKATGLGVTEGQVRLK